MKHTIDQQAGAPRRNTIVYLVILLCVMSLFALWSDGHTLLTGLSLLQINNVRDFTLLTAVIMVAGLGFTSLYLLARLRTLETAHNIDSHAALHDALTGAANRRQFELRLDQLLEDDPPAHTLLMIDLDRFKPINDLYGHAAGDALLRDITQGMKRLVHRDDLVARLGGDEFAMLLTGKVGKSAEQTALDVLQFVSRYRLAWEGQRLGVGASIGQVSIDRQGLTQALLLTASDEALYAAKEAGRGAIFAAELALADDQPTHFRRVDAQNATALPSANSHVPEDGTRQELRARLMTNLLTPEHTDRRRVHGARRRYETRHWVSLEPATVGDRLTPGMSMRELIGDASARGDGGADFVRWMMAMALDAASRMNPVSLGHVDFVLPVPARAFLVVPDLADELMRCNALSHLPIRHITFILHGLAPACDSAEMQNMYAQLTARDFRLGYEIRADNLEVLAPLRHIPFDEIHLGRELLKKLPSVADKSPTVDALLAVTEKNGTSLVTTCVDTQAEATLLSDLGIKRFSGSATGPCAPVHELMSSLINPAAKEL
ncbi:MAG: diguanylate cyclase [Granulosicoccus sp.]